MFDTGQRGVPCVVKGWPGSVVEQPTLVTYRRQRLSFEYYTRNGVPYSEQHARNTAFHPEYSYSTSTIVCTHVNRRLDWHCIELRSKKLEIRTLIARMMCWSHTFHLICMRPTIISLYIYIHIYICIYISITKQIILIYRVQLSQTNRARSHDWSQTLHILKSIIVYFTNTNIQIYTYM